MLFPVLEGRVPEPSTRLDAAKDTMRNVGVAAHVALLAKTHDLPVVFVPLRKLGDDRIDHNPVRVDDVGIAAEQADAERCELRIEFLLLLPGEHDTVHLRKHFAKCVPHLPLQPFEMVH